jgi:hypothetical protein
MPLVFLELQLTRILAGWLEDSVGPPTPIRSKSSATSNYFFRQKIGLGFHILFCGMGVGFVMHVSLRVEHALLPKDVRHSVRGQPISPKLKN